MNLNDMSRDDLIQEITKDRDEISRLKEIILLNETAERRLVEIESKYTNLLRIVPDTIYKIDQNGFFTFISDSIRSLGYKPAELLGKHFSEIIHPDDLPFVSRSMVLPNLSGKKTGLLNSPKLFDERRSGPRITRCLEIRLLSKDWKNKKNHEFIIGSVFSCGEVDSSGHYDEESTNEKIFLGTIGVIRDITDRKKFEENFHKSQRLKSLGILAGGIAHDFNNILTAIIGNITLVKLEVDMESNIYQALSDAEKASLRAKDLTNQLLTFAKGGSPVKNAASISELIMDIAEFTLRGSNVKCRFSFPQGLWPVDIDEGQMGQVINNIIINASQAMPGGGYIDIFGENAGAEDSSSLGLKGKFVKITIRDYGTGIERENIQKIFDPYFSTKEKGSGLGLTTSYSIIKSHGGNISVESDAGKGTIFFVYIPVSEKQIPEKGKVNIRDMTFKGKILLMDDDKEILKATGNILENFGFSVMMVHNGAEAIDSFRKEFDASRRFDLVIMDLTIPGGLGGRETIQILKEIDPGVRSIVSSGYSNDRIMSNYLEFGFDGVVPKPYNLEQLIESISKVLNSK